MQNIIKTVYFKAKERKHMLFRIRILSLALGWCTLGIATQPPAKTPEDLLVGAAGAGNQKGLNYHIITKKMSPDTKNSFGRSALGMAAGNGQVAAVKFLIGKNADVDIKDTTTGLTPLAWASLMLNPQKTVQDYVEVINALIASGARMDLLDNNGLSILHGAVRTGNPTIIELILRGTKHYINYEGSKEKGRTPLAETVRAAKDAIIHIDLENQDITNQSDFAKALDEAIAQLKKKEEKKLSTTQIINTINLLKRYGAKTNIVDALGHTLDYYINEVQLISEPDRINILTALDVKPQPRGIKYQSSDLARAITVLQTLQTMVSAPALAGKIQMLIWTIRAAQQEINPSRHYDILRIGMALIAKTKELAKESITDKKMFTTIENTLNDIRTILRDNALIISKKVAAPHKPAPTPTPKPAAPPTTKPATAPPSPTPPAVKPAAAQPQPALEEPVYRTPLDGILVTKVQNDFNEPVTVVEILDYPGAEMELPEYVEKETIIPPHSTQSLNAQVSSRFNYIRVDLDNNSFIIQVNIDKKEININGKKSPINEYKLSTITIDSRGQIALIPYQAPQAKPTAAPPKPTAAPAPSTQAPKKQIPLHPDSMYITDFLNYSDTPAKLIIHYKVQIREFIVDSAKSKNQPTIKEVMGAGYSDAPVSIESFNQNVTLEVIPGDPSKGKPTQVKRQIINSTKPIVYWNMPDVRQVKIVVESNGDIKIVPDKKVIILDYQKK